MQAEASSGAGRSARERVSWRASVAGAGARVGMFGRSSAGCKARVVAGSGWGQGTRGVRSGGGGSLRFDDGTEEVDEGFVERWTNEELEGVVVADGGAGAAG